MKTIKDIGELQYNNLETEDKSLEIFTEDPSDGGRYNIVNEIVMTFDGNEFTFKEINQREYDDELKYKYLYKFGSSRGCDISPTAKITEPKKTYENKILAAIKDGINYCNESETKEKEILTKLQEKLVEEKEKIVKYITSLFNSIPKKERYLILTVVIEEEEKKKYIGDFEVFKRRIREIPINKFYYSATMKKEVVGYESCCSICNLKKDKVFGLASPYAFYTIDKPGYISGGFDYKNAWRNYPVCEECAIKLELGKNYIDKNLVLSFYGRNFYLIPKPIYSKDLNKVLEKYQRLLKDEDKLAKDIIKPEDRVMKLLAKEENRVTFDLMFFEENNNALNILLNIEDVYPSTFSKLYKAWEDIKNMEFFEDIHYLANFNYLNILYSSKDYNRYFLDMVDKIIGKGRIEYNFLIKFINEKLIEGFKKEEKDEFVKGEDNYYTATFRAYTFIYYLYKINKFRNKGEEGVEDMINKVWKKEDFESKVDAFEDFFNKNKAFFNSDSKKAVFMIGYLSKKLINLQANKEGGRKPFMSNLNSLNLSNKDILRLVPKIQGKLSEYKADYYNEEFQYTSECLILSNSLEDLANLDIPFYFSLGMNMVKKFELNNKEEKAILEA